MILGNIKLRDIIKEPKDILRIFLALVFLSAGVFRIVNPAAVALELKNLQLPYFLSYFLICFEIGSGLLLLFNKYLKTVSIFLSIFLLFALTRGVITNGYYIVRQVGELFVFRANPTDIFLHITFLIILISLVIREKK